MLALAQGALCCRPSGSDFGREAQGKLTYKLVFAACQ